MYWGMGKGAWVGLGLCFRRYWLPGGMRDIVLSEDDVVLGKSGGHARLVASDRKFLEDEHASREDEEMRKIRRRAGLLRVSDGGL
jgi:hypothetical protein